ncbi:SDR family NAD(P)-dependent oxidoreductase [Candidatus Woesearchaeota archaeon]|nr:SDR family NAD(P)-dependent oxidoreductase [Candidatus Woesearchaeota archaeon]
MKTILVTGAAGFIGSHTCEALIAKGYTVIGADDFNDYYDPAIKRNNVQKMISDKRFGLIAGDIRDRAKMLEAFTRHGFDAVVHLAARAGVRASMQNPELYFDVNVNGTKNLLGLAAQFRVKKFVFGSSSSVYGANTKAPFSEDDKLDSIISPYAESKKLGEEACREYHDKFKLPIVCLRFFTVYGPRGRPDMAPYLFVKNILAGKPIKKYGDGSSQRDYTFVSDIVDGIMAAAETELDFEIINLGDSRPITLNQFILTVEKATGRRAIIEPLPSQEGDVPLTFADISKAKRLLGYNPKVKIEEGIRKTVEWMQHEQ